MTYRAHVSFDAAFAVCDRWFLDVDRARIRVRFRIASGPEIVHDVPLEGAKLRALSASGDDWAVGPMRVPDTLGMIEFVLRGAPEHVTAALRRASS